MPANLPPQYFETEKKLKTAKTPEEKAQVFEELLAIVPKHKGTEKLRALLKTKIAKLKTSAEKRPAGTRHGPSFLVEKSGAGQVVVLGPPNAGKSSLIKYLTGANPEVGEYAFTTQAPAPYMMRFENIRIQLVDTPPVTLDYLDTGLAEAAKVADAAVIVVDASSPDAAADLENLFLRFKEKKVIFQLPEAPLPEAVPPYYKRTIVVANKSDLDLEAENVKDLQTLYADQAEIIPFSSTPEGNLEVLKKRIFLLLDIIRVYSKSPGKKADTEEPFTLGRGSTVQDMARAVHKDFAQNLKFARIWSKAKSGYQGNMVNRDHVLEDEDVVELHL